MGRVCVLQPLPICHSAVQEHELKVRGQCGGVGAVGRGWKYSPPSCMADVSPQVG